MAPSEDPRLETYLRDAAEAQIDDLYTRHGRDVLAYALPRSASPEDAADVVAETFLVAWRRARDIPARDEARLWLFGVARRVLANQRRGERRRTRLGERLREELPAIAATQPGPEGGGAVLRALAELSESDRELLLLAGWDELEPAQIARVLEISAVAVRTRLHRARARLRRQLDAEAVPASSDFNDPLQYEEAGAR